MVDEVNDMRVFAQMIEAGNLSAAARAFDSSTAAMSRRLAALERRLGVRLVTRTSRRFELTVEGAQFYERVLAILSAIEEAEAEASAQSQMPRGLLCVGAPSEIGRKQIAPMITAFSDRYPEVEVRLVLSDIGIDVIDDNLDVALRIGLPPDTGVIAKKLLSSRRVVVASPDYLARRGTPHSPADLAEHDCIRLVRGQRVFDRWRLLEEGQPRDVPVSGTLSTANGEVLHDWVLQGRGLALKALWDIQEDLRSGALVECMPEHQCDQIELYAVFASRRHLAPRVRVFLDFVQQAFEHSCSHGGQPD
ncbi:Transcriptional regulator, LysR family [Caballeronia glathei]|jgi:DNA-binding transcriptional LysR family regulator|uniref:LysR family transcriptional regulator n=1 Tax=Caballeronia glathei TaxID=60547 RepID=A0A069PEG9_9BURK|nr:MULTISPECIES: LysR family transcriptional regulator [Burkholderiaceae]KDR39093.1 LysR family transcriptional regulator [Caballeronia glathei]TCK37198.1 DNA-binding transcriptional LysR family regulator [Paraburkholderia sp. BL8N3]CDY78935.1 Transcriptional regulator, LysR family [Caballeronia glathei]